VEFLENSQVRREKWTEPWGEREREREKEARRKRGRMINRFQRDKSTLRGEYLYGGGRRRVIGELLDFSPLYRARVERSYVRRGRRGGKG